MKKIICLMVFLLVVLSCVSARRAEDFSAADAYDWLLKQAKDGSYNNDIVDTAAAFLAIDAAGGTASSEISYLTSQKNDNNCWPKASCKIKDTAWSVMALQKAGESSYVTDAEAWLRKAQTPALTAGNWWLEVDTPNSGTCTVKYTKGATEVSKTIKVEAGTFPECKGGTFFDLETCLESGLLNAFASLELNVDCSSLGSAKISIAYNSGSSYYLYQEVSETTADLIVKNGCFGVGYKEASCNYESSLYSDWVLGQIGSTLSSELYLRENYDSKNSLHNALLYMITKDKAYLEQLKKLQKGDGSWDSNSLYTAFAILALKSEGEGSGLIEKAQEWLKTKQNEDGSWDDKAFNTAMVLYSSFYQGVELPSCTDGVKNQGERGVDCGGPCEKEPYSDKCCDNGVKDEGEDGIDCGGACDICLEAVCDKDGSCESDRGEDCDNCPDDCSSCESLCIDGAVSAASAEEGIDCGGLCLSLYSKECAGVCSVNGKCEINLVDQGYSDNEDSQNCPADCKCGDETCDDYERESETCEEDCPTTALEAECGDGICSEGEDVSCPDDCVEEVCDNDGVCDVDDNEGCSCSDCAEESFCTGKAKSNLKLIIIILLIVVFGGGAYFFLTKKKGPQRPSYELYGRGLGTSRPPEKPGPKGSFFSDLLKPSKPQPSAPAQRPATGAEKGSKMDEEIEKSISEAKKLIKGEK